MPAISVFLLLSLACLNNGERVIISRDPSASVFRTNPHKTVIFPVGYMLNALS